MPSPSDKVRVSITAPASAAGLKELLTDEAIANGETLHSLIGKIYAYAVKNPADFNKRLEEQRPRGGSGMITSVPREVADELTAAAKLKEIPRSRHCCFLLEKSLENSLIARILGN